MSRLLWLLSLFALAVGVSLAARFNDGYLLLVLPPYRAEVSLNLAIFLVVAAFLLLYGLLRAVVLTLSLPQRAREFRAQSRREKAAAAFEDALRLLIEGRFSHALAQAGAAHAGGHSPGLAALLAARAAQQLREPGKEQKWLACLELDDPRLAAARLMLEAEMAIDAGHFAAALATLQRFQQIAGRRIAALRLELRAQQGLGNWHEVLRLAQLLMRRDALLPETAQAIELAGAQQGIGGARRADSGNDAGPGAAG